MPNLVVSLENRLSRSLSAGPIMGQQTVTGMWWHGPHHVARTKELRDVDHYSLNDRNDALPHSKCTDHRFRSLSTKDRSGKQKFGPGAVDAEKGKDFDECWTGQVCKSVPSWASRQARPTHFYDHMGWKLDKYGLDKRSEHSFTTKDRSKSQSFNMSKTERFYYPKLFSKDYSKTGSTLNRFSNAHTWKSASAKDSGINTLPSNFGFRR